MAGVVLKRIRRVRGVALWTKTFPGSKVPTLGTEWYEVRAGGKQLVGWIGYRHRPARQGRTAEFILDGVYIRPQWRGLNLQMAAQEAALSRCQRAGKTIVAKTYVNVRNTSSFLNLVESGYFPVGSFTEGTDVFVNMEGVF